MKRPIVILISGKAEHGKDAFADAFIKGAQDVQGFRCLRIKYGDFLKYVCKEYFGWNGTKDEANREILQRVGTDLCRNNNPDVWTNCVKEVVKGLHTEYDFVLVPDCRFPNELEWDNTPFITYTVRVNRLNGDGTTYINHLTEEQKLHPSETALDDWKFNYTIESKTLGDLNDAAKAIMDDVLKVEDENKMGE